MPLEALGDRRHDAGDDRGREEEKTLLSSREEAGEATRAAEERLEALRSFCESLEAEARGRRAVSQERSLALPRGIDFTSNDYLGLSRHPALALAMKRSLEEAPFGAPASRLLRGNLEAHEDLERKLALWKGTEAALLFPSGYSANLGVLGALVRREDRALSDESNHASLID
ncbi:aminotransferase class I/II-fold pyridoxal phosphate-dependent enzyme, partial [bacterium]|nr:aminotransferase class I/II-fold pyridoxal phosphate-dependent enzyme [bacterium]